MDENDKQTQVNFLSNSPSWSESSSMQTLTTQTPKKISTVIFLILVFVSLIVISFVGYFWFQNNINKSVQPISTTSNQTAVISSMPTIYPTLASENPEPNSFCLDLNYCNMNDICSALPPNHGVCTSDIDCTKYNLCSVKETLMGSGMEVLFKESILDENEKTRVGYMLVRNTNNSKQNINILNVECLNFEGLCKNIKVTYPLSFQINAKDVVIFPVYIENHEGLKGLISLEFIYDIGGKSSMVSVDLIFNNNKTCIYQWGGLETSRKIYFQEKSKIDWTQRCQ